jgi:hypothetical protein
VIQPLVQADALLMETIYRVQYNQLHQYKNMTDSLIQGYRFFRVQCDSFFNEETGEHTRPVLQLCYQKPIPSPPYVDTGIIDITLVEHPELQALVEQATGLAVPIALDKLLNPPTPPIPPDPPDPEEPNI